MKKLQTLTMAVVLILTLAASAFAGDIWLGIAQPPPPPGDIWVGKAPQQPPDEKPTPSDSTIAVALNLLQSVLSVF